MRFETDSSPVPGNRERTTDSLATDQFGNPEWIILNNISEPVVSVNENLTIIRINQQFKNYMEHHDVTGDLIGNNLFDICTFLTDADRNDYLSAFRTMEPVINSSNAVSKSEYHIEEIRKIPFRTEQGNEIVTIFSLCEKDLSDPLNSTPFSVSLQNAENAILIHDFIGNIIAWDRGAEKLYGWSEDEALEKNIVEITHKDDRETYLSLIQKIKNSVSINPFEIRRTTKSGKLLDTWVTGSVLKDESNTPYALAITEYNVTDIKQAKVALRESEDKYKILTQNISVGIVRINMEDNTFIEINPAAREMFQLTGNPSTRRIPFSSLFYNSTDYDKFFQNISNFGFVNKAEYLLQKSDGTPFWCSVTAVTTHGKNTGNKYIDGIILDIDNSKRAEKKLIESEKRYRNLIENLGEGVVVIDPGYNFLLANSAAEKIFDISEKDSLLNHNLAEYIDQNNLELFKSHSMLLQDSSSDNFDLIINIENRKNRIISITCSPYHINDNDMIGILSILRDVTHLRKMEEDIIKATKLESIGILAGGIAHDFNNILTIVLGNISLAKMFLQNDDNIIKRLDKAESAASRAKDLTQQLLTFSKGGAPVKKMASIKDLIEESVNFSLTGSKVECKLDVPDDLWALEIDEGQVSQSINNMIINATQAMPDGGHIFFTVQNTIMAEDNPYSLKSGNYVKISIADEGIGIPPENLESIFDPYFTTKEKGNGLGLSSVYSIITKHGGTITVKSKVGIGTTFDIYLPATNQKAKTKKLEKKRLKTGEGRIIVMDDEADIREVAQILLKNLGYNVTVTKDGVETLNIYKEAYLNGTPYDAVIMDLTIRGGMGGKQTIQKLLEFDPKAKAIVASGYSNDQILSNYKEYGFKSLIAKPFKAKELGEVLIKVIQPEE